MELVVEASVPSYLRSWDWKVLLDQIYCWTNNLVARGKHCRITKTKKKVIFVWIEKEKTSWWLNLLILPMMIWSVCSRIALVAICTSSCWVGIICKWHIIEASLKQKCFLNSCLVTKKIVESYQLRLNS